MIVTTGNDVEMGTIVQYLGVVRGIVVRATSIGAGFIGGLKALGGGNIENLRASAKRRGRMRLTE